VIIGNEPMVMGDAAVRVPSHFERIVFECLKSFLFVLAGMPFRKLPRGKFAFRQAVEDEWRRVLCYGNGFHGFTVFPRIFIEDLVRYQKLGGGDDLVSWSISNWVIWSMTAFPHPVQAVVPKFGEKALGERLVRMYEPLIQSFASKLLRRAAAVEGWTDVPDKEDAVETLRALLRKLAEEYDFMRGKPEALVSSVGAIGPESSPEWREKLDARCREFGLPFHARDLVHVGFPRYVVSKFERFLRESYPWYSAEYGDMKAESGAIVEGRGEVAEVFRAETRRTRTKSDTGPGIPIALEHDGVRYFYIHQAAHAFGVTRDQLRNWDRRGQLPTQRVGDVDPFASATIANRRIYPDTPEMREKLRELAERGELWQADPQTGVLSLKEAARRIGISSRALYDWRKEGRIAEVKEGHRVFIPEAEVERILAELGPGD